MSGEGEPPFDPTTTEGEGAGAEGAVGGDSAGDTNLPPPLQPPQQPDITNPFQPTGATSTLYKTPGDDGETIEMSNMDPEHDEWNPDDIPLLEEFISEEDKSSVVDKTLQFIKNKYKKVDFKNLGPIGWGKRPENRGEIVHFGAKGGEDKILKKDGSGLLKSFTDKFKKAPGPSSEEILAEENQEVRELRQRQNEAEKQLKEKKQQILLEQKTTENVQHLRSRLEQTQARIAALEEEHGSTLEQQSEINRLKQLEKNLQSDLKNEKKKLKESQKKN